MSRIDVPVVVIGAGPAGLATSRELRRRKIDHLVLERGLDVGHTWANLYDSLTLHTGKHLSSLPGMRFSRSTPLFPTRRHFLDYLRRYAERFALPIETEAEVARIERDGDTWMTYTTAGRELRSRTVVVSTGIVASPRIPEIAGRERFGGRVMHSVEYRRPGPFRGRRVLVVGCGNSGGEIASELAAAGVDVTIAVRSGTDVVPLKLFGAPIQYSAYLLTRLPPALRAPLARLVRRASAARNGPPVLPPSPHPPLTRIPLIGFHLVEAIREGRVAVRPGVAALTAAGARFTDGAEGEFDDVVLATGFAPAIDLLGGLVRRDERGFALRSDRVRSADQPELYFVGHNYDSTGGLHNVARDAPIAGALIGRAK
ncbi:MAG: NAD(P)/FAD-dependent oxidoreductase [Gemmatimonadota bacterium]